MNKDKALLIVDVQMAMFNSIEGTSVYNSETVLNNIVKLLEKARVKQTPVVYIQHTDENDLEYAPNTEYWHIHPRIAPLEHDKVVRKGSWDSFHQTTLQETLKAMGVTKLVIAGMQTEFCVDTTCRRAFSLGYESILVKDAHSTFDTPVLTAEQIIKHHNRVWGGRFVELKSTDEVEF